VYNSLIIILSLYRRNILLNVYAKKWTNVQLITVDVVLTPTVSTHLEASAAAAETVTMETDFSASVRL